MKAVVLEIKDGYAAVLSEDGQFRKIKDNGYIPGMELTLEKERDKRRHLWPGMAAIAAALLLFIGIRDFNAPYGTISLDVNPSIEISINRYDRVLRIEAVNDDAEEIVDELNSAGLKYKPVDDAVDVVLSSFSEGSFAAEDGTTYVMISANSGNDKHSDKIANELANVCKAHKSVSAQTITADDALLGRARQCGTTAGKLYLVDSLKNVSDDENFDEAEWLEKPIKEIMHEIDDRKAPGKNAPDDPGENAPDDPGKDVPATPDEVPAQKDPDKPAEDTPDDTGKDVPANPDEVPVQKDPDKPAEGTPVAPGKDVPEKPVQNEQDKSATVPEGQNIEEQNPEEQDEKPQPPDGQLPAGTDAPASQNPEDTNPVPAQEDLHEPVSEDAPAEDQYDQGPPPGGETDPRESFYPEEDNFNNGNGQPTGPASTPDLPDSPDIPDTPDHPDPSMEN